MSKTTLEAPLKNELINFGIIGTGWRAEFYLRIAKELPEKFNVCGIVTRSEEKGTAFEKKWGVKTFRTVEELLKNSSPAFVVVCVTWEAAPVYIKKLFDNGIAVLSETPPAPDLSGLIELNRLAADGGKIQVAEQYHLQPMLAACISVAQSGKLGDISQIQLSVCHGYHAVSLIRKLLGINFENATISGSKFVSPIIGGPDRFGDPKTETIEQSQQIIANINFGDKLGVYNFTGDQYHSLIRTKHLLVRGEKGEISDSEIRYLKDFKTSIELDLKRLNAGENGNLEGYYLKGILAGEQWIYKNPFTPGKLNDDEIAIATCLEKMYLFAKTGTSFYSLAEASQDHYISMVMNEAVNTNKSITTQTQPWATNLKLN